MKAEILNITPEMAKKMLEKNTFNRNISRRVVEQYAESMRRNEWHSNGESISFDEDGNLINGQHRLNACILANTPFCCTVVTGVLKQDAFLFDRGRGRTIRNTVIMAQKRGEMDDSPIYSDNTLVATARYILSIKIGREKEQKADFSDNKKYTHLVTPEQVYEFMKRHYNAFEYLTECTHKMKLGLRKAAIIAALLQAYESGYPLDKLDTVCRVLASGMMAEPVEAVIIRFREKFAKPINDNAAARWEQYMCAQKMLHDFEQGKGNARPAMSKVEHYRSAYE